MDDRFGSHDLSGRLPVAESRRTFAVPVAKTVVVKCGSSALGDSLSGSSCLTGIGRTNLLKSHDSRSGLQSSSGHAEIAQRKGSLDRQAS
jgi:hypothetical protein